MTALFSIYDRVFTQVERLLGAWFLPTLARFSFAAVLLQYFWNSAKTKIGDGFLGFLHPTDTAYIQIFPKAFEAAGYDSSTLSSFHWLVAVAGTCAEFILPLLILIGLLTRLAAIGMTGFIIVQSYVDLTGHGLSADDFGAWFDGASDSLVMDQRMLWISILAILIVKGAGPLSVDRVLKGFIRP